MAEDAPRGTGHVCLGWLRGLSAVLAAAEARIGADPVALEAGLDALIAEFRRAGRDGARVWWVANGGSASLASHISQDLVMRCGLSSSVITDPALMTCAANDHGYGQVYARPLAVHLRAGDLLIAVSSSGNSENIVAACDLALARRARLVALSAFGRDNRLNAFPAAVSLYLPTRNYGHAEIGHESLLHSVIDALAPGPEAGG